ncbi:MAG: ABC transporter [Acidiferrobacteraceae bacterium]|jgi:NitT/TauT family transport system ATP-binding protein|nr:ABC transporter [Acidiferrobacteraceae bacterium]HJP07040.1 ABC transporter ATP-binding protein [Arenicellales bacterium]|tara:strand:- start:4023 stop:4850 length:828 start_codon:yes stop_codon:yes gene_type:complete
MTKSGAISINAVQKIYDPEGAAVHALEDCTCEIPAGKFVAMVGPSGCGKSTLLNMIAGFDSPSKGAIQLDGELLADSSTKIRPNSDRVVVFQNGALFPWKTVLENIAYGPIVQKKLSREQAENEALRLLGKAGDLERIAHSFPGQISSGMQRRVEILRALINQPKILLLDEPFRAMDTVSKSKMHQHLLDIHQRFQTTILLITHDLAEAILLADVVLVMTTRPGTIKLNIDVDLPRPRTNSMTISERFTELQKQAIAAVHEEARKAFERGEKELA